MNRTTGLMLAAAVFLTGACTDPKATPAPAPVSAPSVTVRDLEAEMLCSLDGGTFAGTYGWENGERVPVCVVP